MSVAFTKVGAASPWRSGHGELVIRSRKGRFSTRVNARSVAVSLALSSLALAVFAWSLTVGDFPVPFSDALASIFGRGSADAHFIVHELRLPRGLTALLVGAAFGLSGAIFQRIARNPLASPDIIGINAGATAAAVFAIVFFNATSNQVAMSALTGAAATALAIYSLAYKKGVTGYRLVLVGIGITAMLSSVTSYLISRTEIYQAQRSMVWLTGNLNGRVWEHVLPISVAFVFLFPGTIFLARHLRILELGDETARGLGSQVEMARGVLLLSATALAAVSTAVAGPIAFVALVAPQIARRLTGERTISLVPAAAAGALLLISADLMARRMFSPVELPVGVFTAILGAPYLLYLLARANRIGSGG